MHTKTETIIVVDEVDAKKIAKEVVSKKMKSIVDEVIKDVAPKKEKKVNHTEVINTNNDFEDAPKKPKK
jgi:hypothetical protein